MTDSFDLTMTGETLPGHSCEAAAKALAAMMRLDEAQALGLLAGRETVIKRGLAGDQLPRYLKALEQAGVAVRAEPAPVAAAALPAEKAASAPVSVPVAAPVAAPVVAPAMAAATVEPPPAETVQCPACGAEQPKRNLCRECGTDMPRMRAARENAPDTPMPGAAPSSAPSRQAAGSSTAANPFRAPTARVDDVSTGENNSGGGSGIVAPPGIPGWSWGAFLLNWLWAVFNKTWIGLLCFVPYLGFLMSIYLGIKGRELAWRNKRWDSVEHFNRVQRKWSAWGLVLVFGFAGLGILAAIALPAYVQYTQQARGG